MGALSGPGKALIPLVWALVMLAQRRRWGAILEHPLLLYLGAISYPLYLLNEPVQRGLAMALAPMARGNSAVFTAIWLPTALAGAVLAAAALHRWVEIPSMRQRKKFLPQVIAAPLLE